jgi:hypothetical protein
MEALKEAASIAVRSTAFGVGGGLLLAFFWLATVG